MAVPTIAELFGSSATLNTATKMLTINLADFLANEQLDTPTTAPRIATALIRRWNNNTKARTDQSDCGIVVDDPYKSLTVRGSTTQREYSYSCRIYTPDNSAAQPDPDDVV